MENGDGDVTSQMIKDETSNKTHHTEGHITSYDYRCNIVDMMCPWCDVVCFVG